MTRLRFGVLGTGAINRAVVPGIQQAPDCDVVAIASRTLDRGRAAADELTIDRAFGSYEALLASDEVEAVYISLPNHLHAEWTIAAARAGKHVLCEKPLAMDAVEAAEMVAFCESAGVVLMEAFMYRLHPLWIRTIELVQRGAIGTLVSVQSWFSYFNDDPANIRNISEYGGGALLDIGCYCVDLSRTLFGDEPSALQASARFDPASGVDTLTSAVLEFRGGLASFTCGTRAQPDQRVHIVGTSGRIELSEPSRPFNLPTSTATQVLLTSGGGHLGQGTTEAIELPAANAYERQAAAFTRAVLAGDEPPISPRGSIANMVVLDRIRAATTP